MRRSIAAPFGIADTAIVSRAAGRYSCSRNSRYRHERRIDPILHERVELLHERRTLVAHRRRVERRIGDRAGRERPHLIDHDADDAFRRGVALTDPLAQVRDLGLDVGRQRSEPRQRVLPRLVGPDRLNRDDVAFLHLPGVDELADGPQLVAADARGDGSFERFAHDRVRRAQRRIDDRRRIDRLRVGEHAVFALLPGAQRLQRVVEELVLAMPGDAVLRHRFREAFEVRRQIGVGELAHARIGRRRGGGLWRR